MLGYHVNLLSVAPMFRITLLNKVKIEHIDYFSQYQVHFCPCETDEVLYAVDQLTSCQQGGDVYTKIKKSRGSDCKNRGKKS